MRSSKVLALFAVALVAAGCGGDGDGPAGDAGESVPASQASPEAVVEAYFDAADANDPGAMFALISPAIREGFTLAAFAACVSEQLSPGIEIAFEYRNTSVEDGSTFVEAEITLSERGEGAVPSDDLEVVQFPAVLEAVEIDGLWWTAGDKGGDAIFSCARDGIDEVGPTGSDEFAEDDRGPVVDDEWTIALNEQSAGVHTLVMIKTFSPLEEADIEDLGGRLVWAETEVELCGIGIRSVGDGFVQVGDIFQTTEGCDGDTAMQQAFDEFGPPDSGCVYVRVDGIDDEYCAPLTVATAEEEPESAPEEPDPSLLPDAGAPLGLGDVRLPDGGDAVQALFDELPAELSPGERGDEPTPPGEIRVVYGTTAGCAPVTLRAGDLASLPEGFYPPGWSAEWEVAVFATGADWEVEGSGRDRGTFWVTWRTTCGGDGVADSEVFAATWGAEGGSWVFTAVAAEAGVRDELIEAFVAAAATRDVLEDDDVGPARRALLRRSDLGWGWSSRPRSVDDDPAADAAARAAFEAEPACSTAVEQAEQTDIPVTELLDQLVPDAPAKADSPSFTYAADGTSNVEHTVSVLGAPEEVAADFASIRDIGWPECVAAVFDDLLLAAAGADGSGVTMTDYSVVETPVVFGDDGFGARFFLTFEGSDGDTAEFTFDLSVVGVGRAVSAVSQLSVDGAIDDLDAVAVAAHRRVESEFG